MQLLEIADLNYSDLLQTAQRLNNIGNIVVTSNNLTCLKVDDAYIHRLFPLLPMPGITKPDYFSANGIGAHISIIYPEEKVALAAQQIGSQHSFAVTGIFTTVIHQKRYYALKVMAPTLIAMRESYQLSKELNFKNYWISLHITIATASLNTN